MIFDNRLRIFKEFMELFPNDRPITKFLPEFFKRNKQMGSRDRKNLSQAIYSYYRLGNCLNDLAIEERLMLALFLTSHEDDPFVIYFKPEFANQFSLSIEDKIQLLKEKYQDFDWKQIFPFTQHLSEGIDEMEFLNAQMNQPDLYIRAIKGKEAKLIALLETQAIAYVQEGNCFRLKNNTKLESEEYLFEIQDQSSQHTATYFQPKPNDFWWDCCAASGGKSLLLHQLEPSVRIFASDIRDSILMNLDERFKRAGITKYNRRIIDLLAEVGSIEKGSVDGIILDAPCTGSGTWSRTPEMISQFKEDKIEYFAELQKNIIDNVIQFLKPGAPLIYITCSVFKEENEEQVKMMLEKYPLKLEGSELIKGYASKADTMFVARLVNNR